MKKVVMIRQDLLKKGAMMKLFERLPSDKKKILGIMVMYWRVRLLGAFLRSQTLAGMKVRTWPLQWLAR